MKKRFRVIEEKYEIDSKLKSRFYIQKKYLLWPFWLCCEGTYEDFGHCDIFFPRFHTSQEEAEERAKLLVAIEEDRPKKKIVWDSSKSNRDF